MMNLLFSPLGSGTKGLQKNWCYYFLVLLIMLNSHTHKVAAEPFECHGDFCDTDDGQYCDESEGELRCKYCICSPGPVIPKCQESCAKKMVTTEKGTTEMVTTEMVTTGMVNTEMVTTTLLPVSTIPSKPHNAGSGEKIYMKSILGVLGILLVHVFVITAALIVLYMYVTKKYCFAKPTTPTSSANSNNDSLIKDSSQIQMEDSPIFTGEKLPIEEQGNKRSGQIHTRPTLDDDPERHKLMMENPNDIAIHENKSQRDEAI